MNDLTPIYNALNWPKELRPHRMNAVQPHAPPNHRRRMRLRRLGNGIRRHRPNITEHHPHRTPRTRRKGHTMTAVTEAIDNLTQTIYLHNVAYPGVNPHSIPEQHRIYEKNKAIRAGASPTSSTSTKKRKSLMNKPLPAPNKSIRYITRDDHRLYVHPQTGEFIPGVTSIIDNLPKPFLKAWGQKLVAQDAVAKHEQVGRLAAVDPDAAIDWLKKAPNRFTATAARVGKEAHVLFEELALGNTLGKVSDELLPFVDHFKDYLDTMQPEFLLLEEGVWSEEHDYAGTFDAVVRYNMPDLIIKQHTSRGPLEFPLVGVAWQDNKTTRSGVHPEVGLQLSAYRHAEYLLRPDGSCAHNRPGDFALVLHVRPEGWELIPVEAGQRELDVFLNLRKITDYTRTHSKQIIGERIGGNRQRRAKRKAAE